jgi:hypothetical protein
MNAAKTTAERKAAERAAHKKAGRVRVEVYAHPQDRQAIRDYAQKLATKKAKEQP